MNSLTNNINFYEVPNYTSNYNKKEVPNAITFPEGNMNNLFTKDEKKDIINRFPTLTPNLPGFFGKLDCKYDITYIPQSNTVVINNKSVTNHTIAIDKDGKAISVGSWHRTELDENYKDVVDSIKTRYENSLAKPDITDDLNKLATIGKSQVK